MEHRIAILRRAAGLSQRGLAAKSGVPQSRIAEAESGTHTISAEAALKVAPHLGVNPIDLYLQEAVRSIKAGIETGEDRPLRAATAARALLSLLEGGKLTRAQEGAVRSAVQQLTDLASEAAEKKRAGTLSSLVRRQTGQTYPLDPPDRSEEDEAQRAPGFTTANDVHVTQQTYQELGRDQLGRARASLGADFVDPNMDYIAESGTPADRLRRRKKKLEEEAAIKGTGSMYEELGRDNFGRQRNP